MFPPPLPRRTIWVSLISAAATLISACETTSPVADLVFTNGNIYTVDEETPWAQSVSVKDGLIVALGSDEGAAHWIGPNTEVIDLDGKLVLPAFGDAHVHPIFGGLSFSQCSLHDDTSVEDYIATIETCIEDAPGDGVVFGRGWRPGLFPPDGIPHKDLLDALAPDRALIMQSTGGHSFWVNSMALQLADITQETPDPPQGRIDRDPATGELVGGLQETAMDLVRPLIPPPTDREMQDAIIYTVDLFNSLGITNWHDAGIEIEPNGESRTLDAYEHVRDQGRLSTHVSIALKWDNERSLDQLATIYDVTGRAKDIGFHADAVKLYMDGVIVQRTAAVLEPYVGTTDDFGELHIGIATLNDAVTALDAAGYQIFVHAIGDRAVRETLNAFERARSENGVTDNRHFIAHLNLVAPEDQPRFGQLSVAANFQPLWANENPYMSLTAERVGAQRMETIYPANSILQAGGRLAYGADWPVASANPFMGIEVAMTRQPPGAPDVAPLLTHEGVTLEDAIKAYTLDVAFVTHREDVTGSLTIGKSADLIIVDQDLFNIPVHEISNTRVLLTLFRGDAVYGSLSGL